MLLKFLSFIGRKKVVLDRGPSHPRYDLAKPWMNRYYILFRNRPRWFPFNILIHEMLADDHGEGVHNHLCPYITIILRGGIGAGLIKSKCFSYTCKFCTCQIILPTSTLSSSAILNIKYCCHA